VRNLSEESVPNCNELIDVFKLQIAYTVVHYSSDCTVSSRANCEELGVDLYSPAVSLRKESRSCVLLKSEGSESLHIHNLSSSNAHQAKLERKYALSLRALYLFSRKDPSISTTFSPLELLNLATLSLSLPTLYCVHYLRISIP